MRAPCFFCDEFIVDPSKVTFSTHGKPVCKGCRDDLDMICAERTAQEMKLLANLLDPREARSTDLIRAPRPCYHD